MPFPERFDFGVSNELPAARLLKSLADRFPRPGETLFGQKATETFPDNLTEDYDEVSPGEKAVYFNNADRTTPEQMDLILKQLSR